MFKIYYTDALNRPNVYDEQELKRALTIVEQLRKAGYIYVTMVSDYAHMCGKPGAQMSGTEYVPQMLN